jgi:hypothetical protein
MEGRSLRLSLINMPTGREAIQTGKIINDAVAVAYGGREEAFECH